MSLVDNEGVVLPKGAIPLRFCEKNSIRHELDLRLLADFLGKPNLISNEPSLPHTHLIRNPPGNTGGCKPTRLGTTDPARSFFWMIP